MKPLNCCFDQVKSQIEIKNNLNLETKYSEINW